ncbi:hypothetical protein STEG23_007389, partial [Scotinomys teguina]
MGTVSGFLPHVVSSSPGCLSTEEHIFATGFVLKRRPCCLSAVMSSACTSRVCEDTDECICHFIYLDLDYDTDYDTAGIPTATLPPTSTDAVPGSLAKRRRGAACTARPLTLLAQSRRQIHAPAADPQSQVPPNRLLLAPRETWAHWICSQLTAQAICKEISAPTLGEISAPTLGEISAPTLGEISAPTLGEISAPTLGEISAPTLGEISAPTLGEISAPTLGEISAPTLEETEKHKVA